MPSRPSKSRPTRRTRQESKVTKPATRSTTKNATTRLVQATKEELAGIKQEPDSTAIVARIRSTDKSPPPQKLPYAKQESPSLAVAESSPLPAHPLPPPVIRPPTPIPNLDVRVEQLEREVEALRKQIAKQTQSSVPTIPSDESTYACDYTIAYPIVELRILHNGIFRKILPVKDARALRHAFELNIVGRHVQAHIKSTFGDFDDFRMNSTFTMLPVNKPQHILPRAIRMAEWGLFGEVAIWNESEYLQRQYPGLQRFALHIEVKFDFCKVKLRNFRKLAKEAKMMRRIEAGVQS